MRILVNGAGVRPSRFSSFRDRTLARARDRRDHRPFHALIAIVQYDIKLWSRIHAIAARLHDRGARRLGVFRGDFHLMTHASSKPCFSWARVPPSSLCTMSDMRRMADWWKLTLTYGTLLIGAIASAGVPGLRGVFSKDAIIERCHLSRTPAPASLGLPYGVRVVTAFYTFRLVFYAFHGKARFETHDHAPHESSAVSLCRLCSLPFPRSARAGSSGRCCTAAISDTRFRSLRRIRVCAKWPKNSTRAVDDGSGGEDRSRSG